MATAQQSKGALIFGSAIPRAFSDFANGKFIELNFENPVSNYEVARGGSIITYNSNSEQATLTVRLVRASMDDIFLNGVLADYKRSPETFVLMAGSTSLKFGDGSGSATTENYILSEGSFQNPPAFGVDTNGDIEIGITIWTFNVKAVRNFA